MKLAAVPCVVCGTVFQKRSHNSIVCSEDCSVKRVAAYESARSHKNRARAIEWARKHRNNYGARPNWVRSAEGLIKQEYAADVAFWKKQEWSKSDFPDLFRHEESQEALERRRAVARVRERIPLNRIKSTLRLRIRKTLRGKIKHGRTLELTGCTREFLIKWLERQFTRHMSWENYATFWVVDHKVPCAAFDLSTPEGQRQCFHYTNLQPLERVANIVKGDSVLPTQPELTLALS